MASGPVGNLNSKEITEVHMLRTERIGWLVLGLMSWGCWHVSPAMAQRQSSATSDTMKLTTKDGVRLKVSYYPSSLGKEAVPVVMLHDFKESRAVFNGLAQVLQNPLDGQRPSHAVITVDLRGHGESTSMRGSNGQTRELEAARLGKNDFRNMVLYDMEAVRKFLVKKNDAGELNLNKLCLLGSGMGGNVATAWAAVDWNSPKLANRKQGQDVKGLILASPDWGYRGLPMLKPLRNPGVRKEVSVLIIYGKQDRKSTKSAETVHKNLKKFHRDPPPEQRHEKQDLFLVGLPTSLKGTRLLVDPNFGMLPVMEEFLDARLSQQDFEWVQRRRPN